MLTIHQVAKRADLVVVLKDNSEKVRWLHDAGLKQGRFDNEESQGRVVTWGTGGSLDAD
jgi:hypothetical protein